MIALNPLWADTYMVAVLLCGACTSSAHPRAESGIMALFDWILVVFGLAIAFTGCWIQLHPERISPGRELEFDSSALAQIRRLGACFLFMGDFFACQMTIDLSKLPWWMGTLSGLVTATLAVIVVSVRVRRGQVHRRGFAQQTSLPPKVLELR
jgi:hypothetical protein